MWAQRIEKPNTIASRVNEKREWSCFWWLWSFIGIVSLYDAWLVVVFREFIESTERNPVGRLLIELDSGGVTYFLTAKLTGTVIALLALVQIYHWLERYRHWIIGGVASFQAWLLYYLSFVTT